MGSFELILGDITRLPVDGIVNAAKESLMGGGGVDGAIHQAAGPGLLEECRIVGPCPTGQARITGGYQLAAKNVIHTVGPVWRGGTHGEERLLASAYRESLKLAVKHGLKSLAFPNISTGVYGFPLVPACEIALAEVAEFCRQYSQLSVTFCCFTEDNFVLYEQRIPELLHS